MLVDEFSLEGCTKRSGCNPGQSPGGKIAGQLPGRQYLEYKKYIAYA